MALEILASVIPNTVGGAIALLVQILIIWVIIILSDKLIVHRIEAKHSIILAVLAYFVSPLVLAFGGISIPFAGIIIPLIVWVVLSELLLRGLGTTVVTRLKVAAIAFVIYFILNYAGITGLIAANIRI